ncbi:sulfotransferase family 2 domain-containing protein [Prosthecomicrobium sp. N25]|uniref:sulfotransferase family 2 domain-containing protein n=1 Tax=Prosthecomicrobium sp. N25 TaxID=3129254 RepID=UPI003077A7E4
MSFAPVLASWLTSFLPGREAHFVVVPRLRLVYARVPKVANTAVRSLLADHVDRTAGPAPPPNKDSFWRGDGAVDGRIVSGAEVLGRYGDHLCFTIVRDPFDRLVSCWSDMIARPAAILPNLDRLGFRRGMEFGDFVERVARIPDRAADLHFRSQASIVSARGRVVPSLVGRMETIGTDWERVRAAVLERTGTDLGSLPQKNVRRRDRSDVQRLFADGRLVDRVRVRYADDFRLFYPGREAPEPAGEAGPTVA